MAESRTIEMKQARPDPDETDRVIRFLYGLRGFIESRTPPATFADEDPQPIVDEAELRERLVAFVRREWDWRAGGGGIGDSWERVLWAGKCAIDSACDPAARVLEWRLEIRKALEFYAANGPRIRE